MRYIKTAEIAIFCLFSLIKISFSYTDSIQKAISIKISPHYSEANADLLPKGYINKSDTCIIMGITVDTAGIPWFKIKYKLEATWSPSKYWKYLSEIDTSAFVEKEQSDEDKKRRLLILREHKDWPRRIIRAIRFGRICLDMDEVQLTASWGDPIKKSGAFTIGLGEHAICIYQDSNKNLTTVILQNNKVIGWSVK